VIEAWFAWQGAASDLEDGYTWQPDMPADFNWKPVWEVIQEFKRREYTGVQGLESLDKEERQATYAAVTPKETTAASKPGA